MTGGVSVDLDKDHSKYDLEKALMAGELAEYLPLDIEYFEDDWEFEEIEEEKQPA